MATNVPDYYQILGVPFSADFDAIKKAYRYLANQHHPDKNGSQEADFALINEAYHVLKDPIKRKKYDNLYQRHFGVKNSYHAFDAHGVLKHLGRQFGQFVKTAETFFSSNIDNLSKKPRLTIDLNTAMMGGELTFKFLNKFTKVMLPKGLYPDAKIKLMIQNTPVWFRIDVTTPKNITLNKKDVHLTHFLDIWQVALGEKITVTYGSQTLQVDLSAVDTNQPILFANQGIPALNEQKAGNLYIYLVINAPNYYRLTGEQKQAFLALKHSFD